MRILWCSLLLSIFVFSLPVYAGRIVIDADAFEPGAEISHAIPGVVLAFEGGARFPGSLPSAVTRVVCEQDSSEGGPFPPACERNSLGVAYLFPQESSIDPPRLFFAEFDVPIYRVVISGLSTSGSIGVGATRLLGEFEDPSGADPESYESFVIPAIGGVDRGRLHFVDHTFQFGHTTLYIGSSDAFYPTRIVAYFVPEPDRIGVTFMLLGLLASIVTHRRNAVRSAN